MRRALLSILTAVALAACVPPLPGGSLDGPDGGSAGAAASSTGGAGATASGSGGMGGRATGFAGAGPGPSGAAAGPGPVGMAGSQGGGPSSGPGAGGGPGCTPRGDRVASTDSAANIALNIAVDSKSLFWVQHAPTSTILVKAPVGGGDVVTLANVNGTNNWVAVGTSGVYWSETGSGNSSNIFKIGVDGGTPATVVASAAPILRFTLGADGVYWTTGTGVMKSAFDGGTPTTLTPQQSVGEIVVDAANLYWVRVDAGTIMKVATAGGADPIVLASGQAGPISLALDGQQHLYWVNQAAGLVMRTAIDGSGPPQPLLFPSSVKTCNGLNAQARSVAVDAMGVYWTDVAGNVFAALPGEPMNGRLLAGGWTAAFGIVLDATTVYWMTATDILKIAR
jgi:hypothetical protein